LFSLDFSRKSGPISSYLYYVAAIVVVIIVGLIGIRMFRNRRRKNN